MPAAEPPAPLPAGRGSCHLGDNLTVLRGLPDGCVDCVYTDPPFNTGRARRQPRVVAIPDDAGAERFGGRRYRTVPRDEPAAAYADAHDDYLGFLEPRLVELRRVLAPHGTLYLHLDQRESHYVKVLLDRIFGRDCFLNEVVWAYDYGGRGARRWPAKHDTILVYVRRAGAHWFDRDAVERIPYLAPSLAGPARAARGKLPTDVWWHTVVPTSGAERTGYPTQKPVALVRRALQASCPPGGLVADPFAGSGTTAVAAAALGLRFLLVDDSPDALAVQRRRLAGVDGVTFVDGRLGPPRYPAAGA